jgi:PleD family two-component response regulator
VLVNPIENALKLSPASEPFRVQVTTTSAEVLIRVMANNSRVLAGVEERARRDVRARAARGAGGGTRVSKSAVLVVDDAQHILLALRRSLRGAGNEVDTADTAQDASRPTQCARPGRHPRSRSSGGHGHGSRRELACGGRRR